MEVKSKARNGITGCSSTSGVVAPTAECRTLLPTTKRNSRQFRQKFLVEPQILPLFNQTAAALFGISVALTRVDGSTATRKPGRKHLCLLINDSPNRNRQYGLIGADRVALLRHQQSNFDGVRYLPKLWTGGVE
jgi:hypothetical protein